MCDICLMSKCKTRCPNEDEQEIFKICVECGDNIYRGEECYKVDNSYYCEDCICDMRVYAL